MERLTKRFDGWVMREGCQGPCRTCNGAKCADIFPMIDRLAAYEDSGLTPDEVTEYQHLCETYVEAGLDSKFVQICIDATKRGATVEQIMELGLPNDPLTLEELRGMGGEPVWIHSFSSIQKKTRVSGWAIVETVGSANATFVRAGVNCRTAKWFANYGSTWLAYRRKPKED